MAGWRSFADQGGLNGSGRQSGARSEGSMVGGVLATGRLPQSGRVKGPWIDAPRPAISDELGHNFPGRRGVEDAPDAMAGCDVGAADLRHLADQRQAVLGEGTEARLRRDNPVWAQR